MLPTLLLIQFRKNVKAAELEATSVERECCGVAEVVCMSALDCKIPWHHPEKVLASHQGIIFGGSGDFDFDGGRHRADEAVITSYAFLEQLRPLLSYIFLHDVRTLGICFGHQLLGVFAGAEVIHDTEQKKTRSHPVTLHTAPTEHALLNGLPQTFEAHYVHKDSLDRVPPGAALLMSGGRECRFSALQYGHNIYSTQFHPELTFEDLLARIDLFPGYLDEGVTPESVFSQNTESNTILRNFAQLVGKTKT